MFTKLLFLITDQVYVLAWHLQMSCHLYNDSRKYNDLYLLLIIVTSFRCIIYLKVPVYHILLSVLKFS